MQKIFFSLILLGFFILKIFVVAKTSLPRQVGTGTENVLDNEVDPAFRQAQGGVSGQLLYEKLPLRGAFIFRPSSSGQALRYSAGHNKNFRPIF
jgi:hypothetical protein